jgi:hypothetical protein
VVSPLAGGALVGIAPCNAVARGAADVCSHLMPRPLVDAREVLDIDLDWLTRTSSLVPLCGVEVDSTEPTHPDTGQDRPPSSMATCSCGRRSSPRPIRTRLITAITSTRRSLGPVRDQDRVEER